MSAPHDTTTATAAETPAAVPATASSEQATALPQPETTHPDNHIAAESQPTEEITPVEAPKEKATVEGVEQTALAGSSKTAEPVTSGKLGYKAPGLLKQFTFSKKHFWLGDEPVSTQHLSNYLRGEKPEVAHPTAAWSSQTGKGLLYFTKHAENKSHPDGVLNLADATDLEKQSPHEFSFKLHGHKHTFKAASDADRDGWYSSLEKAIPEAKSAKEGILSSEGYKESVSHLGKPAALAGGVAAGSKARAESTPKKSGEFAQATRTASSSSSSSSDAEKAAKKHKKKSQSRSMSRGKRASIFGKMLEKKDEHDIKREEKKEEKAEAKEEKKLEKEAEAGAVGGAAALDAHAIADRVAAAPVAGEATPAAAATETETETTQVPAATEAATTEAPKTAASPKPTKRASIFGSFFEKVRSPTSEKKESEVGPVVPPKDMGVSAEPPTLPEPATGHVPLTAEAPAAATETVSAVAPATETSAAATSAAPAVTPGKEKSSFLGGFMNKARGKSPVAEKRTPSVSAEAPAVPPKNEDRLLSDNKVEGPATAAAPAATEPLETTATTSEPTAKTVTPGAKDARRKSYFGSLGNKKERTEGETEEKPLSKFSSMFRKPSQAMRGSKKENVAPTETAASTEATEAAAPAAEHVGTDGPVGESRAVEPVAQEAIPVGHAQQQHSSTPVVSASA